MKISEEQLKKIIHEEFNQLIEKEEKLDEIIPGIKAGFGGFMQRYKDAEAQAAQQKQAAKTSGGGAIKPKLIPPEIAKQINANPKNRQISLDSDVVLPPNQARTVKQIEDYRNFLKSIEKLATTISTNQNLNASELEGSVLGVGQNKKLTIFPKNSPLALNAIARARVEPQQTTPQSSTQTSPESEKFKQGLSSEQINNIVTKVSSQFDNDNTKVQQLASQFSEFLKTSAGQVRENKKLLKEVDNFLSSMFEKFLQQKKITLTDQQRSAFLGALSPTPTSATAPASPTPVSAATTTTPTSSTPQTSGVVTSTTRDERTPNPEKKSIIVDPTQVPATFTPPVEDESPITSLSQLTPEEIKKLVASAQAEKTKKTASDSNTPTTKDVDLTDLAKKQSTAQDDRQQDLFAYGEQMAKSEKQYQDAVSGPPQQVRQTLDKLANNLSAHPQIRKKAADYIKRYLTEKNNLSYNKLYENWRRYAKG